MTAAPTSNGVAGLHLEPSEVADFADFCEEHGDYLPVQQALEALQADALADAEKVLERAEAEANTEPEDG